MTTPQHCPGFNDVKNLKSFVCKCPGCKKEKEIFLKRIKNITGSEGKNPPLDFKDCVITISKNI